ncbi:hypothetical protein Tco_1391656 [Tanacetum coccineum]
MYIMTSRPRTRVSVQAPFGGVTDWYPEPSFVISIYSDSSYESVGSSISRVILIGFIPIEVPVAPEVRATAVDSPVGVLELDTHSSSESDPLESSRHVSSTPHDAMVARWRSKIASRSSSLTTSNSEIPVTPILPAPPTIDIPVDRLYRTHPGGPCRALTARKSVRPLPSHRLALRYTSHHLDHFTSGSSSDHSSSDHSSADHSSADHTSGHSTSDKSLSRHSSPPLPLGTRPRLWLQSPVSSTCFSSTAKSSPSDSLATTSDRHLHSPSHSARPSHKRCRSPATIVPSSIPTPGALVPTLDMDVEVGVDVVIGIEIRDDIEDEDEGEAESSDRGTMEVVVDVVVMIDIPNGMLMPDVVEHLEQVEEVVQDIYRHIMDIPLQRVEDIEMGQRQLEAESLIASGERVGLLDHIMTITRSGMTPKVIKELINQRVAETLATYKANRAAELVVESQSQNRDDGDNENDRGNGDINGGGNGNKNRGGNGNCQPLNFKGTEGVVGLTMWFEKIETVFHISNCPERYQVKYATCTLLNSALTWWNAHKRTVRADVAFSMSWRELMKLMSEVYCPRNEIQKMESEL